MPRGHLLPPLPPPNILITLLFLLLFLFVLFILVLLILVLLIFVLFILVLLLIILLLLLVPKALAGPSSWHPARWLPCPCGTTGHLVTIPGTCSPLLQAWHQGDVHPGRTSLLPIPTPRVAASPCPAARGSPTPPSPSSSSPAVAKGLFLLWAVPARSTQPPTLQQIHALVRHMAEDARELFFFYVSATSPDGRKKGAKAPLT